ncbi:fido domain-containing protein [Fusarium redolens]|jgi:hypothetical protein|uniref:Fido domain-containing protein n=1 Tax=Fusarium redolens TaxID=48865 RepID=A0A9P9KVJ8_FUSRE|nr:fido domain-containing protein [Fusarium redolens]KAH7269342.1 fido domain-containing protein [Fusarium redolens]
MEPYSLIKTLGDITQVEPAVIVKNLSCMIYGSNMIGFAGGSLATTYRLCCAVFDEEGSQLPEDITMNDVEYTEIRQHLIDRKLPWAHDRIQQSYRETLQHAQAAKYLIEKICIEKDFSENTIKETHGILTNKIDIDQNTPWPSYSGTYRNWDGRSNSHIFTDVAQIPNAIHNMVNALMAEISLAVAPYDGIAIGQLSKPEVWARVSFASKYCHRFVNIHPFADGNGRMCRLLLNALLLRVGVCPAVIGVHDRDRKVYLRIAVNGSQNDLQNQGEAVPEPHLELAAFVLAHVQPGLWSTKDLNTYLSPFLQVTGRDNAMLPQ